MPQSDTLNNICQVLEVNIEDILKFNEKTNPYVLGSIFVYDIVDATAF